MGRWTGIHPNGPTMTNARKREAVEDRIRQRRRDQRPDAAILDDDPYPIEPLVCPRCGQFFVLVNRCPDCDALLVEEKYAALASEGKPASPAKGRLMALAVAAALTIGGGLLMYWIGTT